MFAFLFSLCLRLCYVCVFCVFWLVVVRVGNAGYMLITKRTCNGTMKIGFSQRPVQGLAGTASNALKHFNNKLVCNDALMMI